MHDSLYGHWKYRLNKKKELFGSDYIYLYVDTAPEDDDVVSDYHGEIGVNRQYGRFHDSVWCDEWKDEDSKERREIAAAMDEMLANASSDDFDELDDITALLLGED